MMLHYDGDVDLDVYQARHIYALRHCERVDNVNPFWHYGNPRFLKDNPPLSDRGVAQAKEVALSFQFKQIDFIFSSPYERCIETAHRIIQLKQPTSLKVKVEPGLLESAHFCYSELQFRWPSFETAEQLFQRYECIDLNYDPVFKGYDCNEEIRGKNGCYPRVKQTMQRILKKCKGDILVIGHTSSLDAIDSLLCYYGEERVLNPGQATITKYEENPDMPGNFTPSYSADCSHLSPGLRQTLRGNSMVEKKNLRD